MIQVAHLEEIFGTDFPRFLVERIHVVFFVNLQSISIKRKSDSEMTNE